MARLFRGTYKVRVLGDDPELDLNEAWRRGWNFVQVITTGVVFQRRTQDGVNIRSEPFARDEVKT